MDDLASFSNDVAVLGLGARTTIGRSAASSSAAVRAGIGRIGEHPFFVDKNGDPVKAAMASYLPESLPVLDRMIALAVPAIKEALAPFRRIPGLRPVPIFLGLPSPRPGLPGDLAEVLVDRLGREASAEVPIGDITPIPAGHAAGILAIERAFNAIRDGKQPCCLVGGVDSLTHAGSTGMAIATVPDVCKTPTPTGPVPMPYPNIARSTSLAKGSKRVKVDGGNPAAIKGSEFGQSNGDEAGTAGGVKSSVNMKEATWILTSMDVKIEGKNACRLSDKMQMNKGNTVCLGGELQAPVLPATPPAEVPCEQLKAEFGVESGTHGNNRKNATKGSSEQSHHIFQDATMRTSPRLLSYKGAQAVMLNGGSTLAGSEHDIANKRQAARTRKEFKQANPNPNYGNVKKWARDDLATAFKEAKPQRPGMTAAKADRLADCLQEEADKAATKDRKERGKQPNKIPDNEVRPPAGCFAEGTLVWLGITGRLAAQCLRKGDTVKTRSATATVRVVKNCASRLVVLDLGAERVSIAPFDRVRLVDGQYVYADAIKPGFILAAGAGSSVRVLNATSSEEAHPIFSFALGDRAECPIGESGIWVEIPESAVSFGIQGLSANRRGKKI